MGDEQTIRERLGARGYGGDQVAVQATRDGPHRPLRWRVAVGGPQGAAWRSKEGYLTVVLSWVATLPRAPQAPPAQSSPGGVATPG